MGYIEFFGTGLYGGDISSLGVNVWWGYQLNDPYINDQTPPNILFTKSVQIQHNANIAVMPGINVTNTFFALRVPATESVKTSYNNGTTQSVGDTIPGQSIRKFTTGGFTYYVSRYPFEFDYTQPLNFVS